jgi:hypothetical protein
MRRPDAEEIRRIHDVCPVGLISLAVELDGALPFLAEMRKMGIVTSAAHSAASYADFQAARGMGLSHLTHYCNQMSALHHRNVGLVGAALLDDGVMIEVICDGIHLCPDMIRLIFKHRSCDRLMLITDSIAAAHLGDGRYPLHDGEIIVKDGAARIAAGGKDDQARLRSAFRTALARDPKPAELTALTAFLAAQRSTYRSAPAEAEKLLRIGLAPPTAGDVAELAAWTQVARVLLNSQEVITRY